MIKTRNLGELKIQALPVKIHLSYSLWCSTLEAMTLSFIQLNQESRNHPRFLNILYILIDNLHVVKIFSYICSLFLSCCGRWPYSVLLCLLLIHFPNSSCYFQSFLLSLPRQCPSILLPELSFKNTNSILYILDISIPHSLDKKPNFLCIFEKRLCDPAPTSLSSFTEPHILL